MQVTPQMDHFTESAFDEIDTSSKVFYSSCKEDMMVNLHKRNRERGESKLKFEVSLELRKQIILSDISRLFYNFCLECV